MYVGVGCGWAGGGFVGASSVPAVGGAVWVVSVGVAPGPSGGGVGRVLVDMVNVEEDENVV